MQPTRSTMPTNSPRASRPATLACALILSVLSGCAATPTDAPRPTVQCPRPTPLPAAVRAIDLRPSTASLSQASAWSADSEAILNGAIRK